MTKNNFRLLSGIALIVVGAILALVFPDLRFLIFQGRPAGVVMVIVGVFDVFDSRRTPKSGALDRAQRG